jgi:hypothetical protein
MYKYEPSGGHYFFIFFVHSLPPTANTRRRVPKSVVLLVSTADRGMLQVFESSSKVRNSPPRVPRGRIRACAETKAFLAGFPTVDQGIVEWASMNTESHVQMESLRIAGKFGFPFLN